MSQEHLIDKMKTASNIFFQILSIAALLFFFQLSAESAPKRNPDFSFTRISGNSMLPTLQSGEMAVVYKAYPYHNLQVGDVVIIESKRGYNVIHRIVRRYRGNYWVTQGDNNRREDREVLSQKNFGGLALVDESMTRYQTYMANLETTPSITEREKTQVAMADQSETDSKKARFARLRKL